MATLRTLTTNRHRWRFLLRWLGLCGVLLSTTGCVAWLTPTPTQALAQMRSGQYQLDRQHATLLFKVEHLGLSSFVGRFNDFDARLDFDPDNIAQTRLQAVVNTASVDVNNEKFARALRGRFWLHSEVFPQAVFTTSGAPRQVDNTLILPGALTLLGVTRPIEVTVQIKGAATNYLTGKYTLGFAAEATFFRSDFGLDRFTPAVGDEITLEVHAEFQRSGQIDADAVATDE